MIGEPKEVLMIEPELGQYDETDNPAQKFREHDQQPKLQLDNVVGMVQFRHPKIEDQQSRDDCKDAVAEGRYPGKGQFRFRESVKNSHQGYNSMIESGSHFM